MGCFGVFYFSSRNNRSSPEHFNLRQSGHFPLEMALRENSNLKAMVLIEPGTCNNAKLSDEQVSRLAKIPLLVVYGDHLSNPTGLPGPGWQARFDECQTLIKRIQAHQGKAKLLHPPEMGIFGNSHMMMQDRNNLQIADFILEWIEQNIASK